MAVTSVGLLIMPLRQLEGFWEPVGLVVWWIGLATMAVAVALTVWTGIEYVRDTVRGLVDAVQAKGPGLLSTGDDVLVGFRPRKRRGEQPGNVAAGQVRQGAADVGDEILLAGLESELRKHRRDLVIVLHQLGNHGPAYHRRAPAAMPGRFSRPDW